MDYKGQEDWSKSRVNHHDNRYDPKITAKPVSFNTAKRTQIFLNVSLSVISTIALPGAWPFLLGKRQSNTWCARNLISILVQRERGNNRYDGFDFSNLQ